MGHHCDLADQSFALLFEVGLIPRPCRGGRAVGCGHFDGGALRVWRGALRGAALNISLVGLRDKFMIFKVAKVLALAPEASIQTREVSQCDFSIVYASNC